VQLRKEAEHCAHCLLFISGNAEQTVAPIVSYPLELVSLRLGIRNKHGEACSDEVVDCKELIVANECVDFLHLVDVPHEQGLVQRYLNYVPPINHSLLDFDVAWHHF
jgi:hypothetical protein